MFALALLYYLLTSTLYKMNIMNVSYEIIPPTAESLDRDRDIIEERIMQASIERFGSFDEYMEIPGFGGESRESELEEEDDKTIGYDDELYQFPKCGEIEMIYSDFWESETVVPDHSDYFPQKSLDGQMKRALMSDIHYYSDDDDDDDEYLTERRYERMYDRIFEHYDRD